MKNDKNKRWEEKRIPVQATRSLNMPEGTISKSEHLEAWEGYAKRYGRDYQSARRIAQRGGFDYAELLEFLGRDPVSWKPR